MRILVVEDERLLAEAVAEWLRGDAHAVDVVNDGGAALERLSVNEYDVVVLDRDLPVVHGDRVCREIVNSSAGVRVLMLTAAADIDDRVAGLVLGADDYLSKPFAFRELSARIQALASVVAVGLLGGAAGVPIGVAVHSLTLPSMARTAGTSLPPFITDVYLPAMLTALVFGGLVVALLGAMIPSGWAARVRTATALRTE